MSVLNLILAAANLLPVVGVLYWGWDAFVLLILYWLETAIIGFWTIVRIVADPPRIDVNGKPMNQMSLGGRIALGLFVLVHAGIFMAVHFFFLWGLFSGDWPQRIHGPVEFVRELIIGTDLWIPLLFLFVIRGFQVLMPPIRARFVSDAEPSWRHGNPLIGLYVRIFIMQATIIIGAWFTVLAGGGTAALILLVALKTVLDLFYDRIIRKAVPQAETRRP